MENTYFVVSRIQEQAFGAKLISSPAYKQKNTRTKLEERRIYPEKRERMHNIWKDKKKKQPNRIC